MEKVITTSTTSYNDIKRLMNELKRTKGVLKEYREKIENKRKDLREEQYNLAYENDKYDVGVSKILSINADWGII